MSTVSSVTKQSFSMYDGPVGAKQASIQQDCLELVDPTQDYHAANKAYADAIVAAQLAGGNPAAADLDMDSHKILNVTDPTTAQGAATKAYVDAKVLLPGGAVAMGTNKITGLGTPTAATDAATKGYVDGGSVQAITSTSNAAAINWSTSRFASHTLTENTTLSFTAPAGLGLLFLKIVQAASAKAITWPATVTWAGGSAPTLSATENAVDIVQFYYDGTNYHGFITKAFAVPT